MNQIRNMISNGYIPILPILFWNVFLTSKLPPEYQPREFNHNIPALIQIGENAFRLILFSLPLFAKLDINSKRGRIGLFLYTVGIGLYFFSWVLLIYFSDHSFIRCYPIFIAPAYTPLFWLIGIAFMIDSYYFPWKYKIWHMLLPSFLFLIFHIHHASLIYFRSVSVP
ncbi:hypothetical protein [Leptospira stimsonii]|uniref:Uncharacterized protein n=1 Tax=Leptospira stimsonii TaxID=2202203 RepID=A0ABY2N530_9LEPT|nr:hypothetical protein [Leptospira stimsonii]TGK22123.1 hypothetical protein EHO98_07505 [Leptospira stimsonii]TGM16851.1 hypothetical protein EHQ90_08920 [Leptospira stimsonii]